MNIVRKHTVRAAADLGATLVENSLAIPIAGALVVSFRVWSSNGLAPVAGSIQVASAAAGPSWNNVPSGCTVVGAVAGQFTSGAGYIMSFSVNSGTPITWKYARFSVTGHATLTTTAMQIEAEVIYGHGGALAFELGQKADEAAS